ncbi:MAG: PAS domain S-box protein [Campylobacterota bacterium]
MSLLSFKTAQDKEQLQALEENYAIISFKPNGTILNANKNFLKTLDYNLNEIKGKHHSIFCEESYKNSYE